MITSLVGTFLTLFGTEVTNVLRVLGLPHVWQQLFQVVLAFGETLQHVTKISPNVQVMSMRASHDRQDDRSSLSACLAADEHPILASNGNAPQITLCDLAERILRALEAGAAAGGDNRCPAERPALTAFLCVARPGDDPDAPSIYLVAPRAFGLTGALWNMLSPYVPEPGEPSPVEVLRQMLDASPHREGRGRPTFQ